MAPGPGSSTLPTPWLTETKNMNTNGCKGVIVYASNQISLSLLQGFRSICLFIFARGKAMPEHQVTSSSVSVASLGWIMYNGNNPKDNNC